MRPGAEDIRSAYRLLLGREADPGGLAHYAALAERGELGFDRLREVMLGSDEYRRRLRSRRRGIRIGGATVVVDEAERDFGAAIARDGVWEPHVLALLDRLLAPGAVFVDVGANVGAMALPAAARVGPTGRVIGFEPLPANATLFLQGVVANGFGHVVLYPLALSDAPGVFAMQGGSNGYLVAPERTELMVQAVRGDDLLAGEPRIDLVKLDIEGREPWALRGLARTLARHRPWVLCEFNPRCLALHPGASAESMAAQVFALAPEVTALRHDGREERLGSAAALLEFWAACDREAVAGGLLPPGMVHLDLLFRPDR